MKAAVIMNLTSGESSSDSHTKLLKDFFIKKGIEPVIYVSEGEDAFTNAKEAIQNGTDVIVAVGGDGTISAVVRAVAGSGKPLAVIPMGTFNHFAKDLNIPLDMEEAVKLIKEGEPGSIDIGEVNGITFINNSSVGIYPKAVKIRDEWLERIGGKKWFAMLISFISVFKRFPLFSIKLKIENKEIINRTPFVFVGNNEYKIDLFNLGIRETLCSNKLSIYTAHCSGRWGLIKIVFKALFNKLHQDEDFTLLLVNEMKLESKRKVVDVSIDGEVIKMKTPLYYKIRPGQLTVILPKNQQMQ